MLFEVRHVTALEYSEPVVLEPTVVRLRPRAERHQQTLEFSIDIDPTPAGSTEFTDVEGNDALRAWFVGKTSRLTITTALRARTTRTNPFDYVILDPDLARLPARYPEPERAALGRFLDPAVDQQIRDWAQSTVADAGGDGPRFASLLASRIAAEFDAEVRLEGAPRTAPETLSLALGSCRDLTVLFIDACRSVGLAARFVSGYQQGDPEEQEKHLHAWGEVFIPSIGWRAFDPTLGLVVADAHLALAAAPGPAPAAPTEGTFRGSAQVELTSRLQVVAR